MGNLSFSLLEASVFESVLRYKKHSQSFLSGVNTLFPRATLDWLHSTSFFYSLILETFRWNHLRKRGDTVIFSELRPLKSFLSCSTFPKKIFTHTSLLQGRKVFLTKPAEFKLNIHMCSNFFGEINKKQKNTLESQYCSPFVNSQATHFRIGNSRSRLWLH